METKASYVTIGSIVLLLLIAALSFVVWVVKVDLDREFTQYDIIFDSAVTGLSPSAPVRYNGVDVGRVKSIKLVPNRPSLVRVTIAVDKSIPIREDSTASLEYQGLTGVSFVQISGGTQEAKLLKAKPEEERPVISGRPSSIEALFTGVPGLISEASQTLSEVRALLNPENRALVSDILENVKSVSGGIASRSDKIASTVDNLDAALVEVRGAVEEYGKLARSLDAAVNTDVKPTLERFNRAAQSLETMAKNLDAMVADSRGPVTAFTANTLPEASKFVAEARRLAASLARIAERLERNPADFVFPPPAPEYKAK